MQVVEVTYERTFNLGNYESMKLGVKLSVNEGEDGVEAMNRAEAFVLTKKEGKNVQAVVAGAVNKDGLSSEAVKPAKKETKKPRKSKAKKEAEESPSYSAADVQAKLKEVAQAKGSRDVPMTILKEKGGAEKLSDVSEDKYALIMKELEKCLK